jgi:outer membrane protein OmpA-like peptidoglycan-associated protein
MNSRPRTEPAVWKSPVRMLGALWVLVILSVPASAFVPEFSGTATVTASLQEGLTSYRLPLGPFANGAMQTRVVEGVLDQTTWRIAQPDLTTLSLLAPLREQLKAQGWRILFECETDACGGFDFRYGTNVMPEPDMHVDLADFRFLSAEHTTAKGSDYLTMMVSRSTESGFLQITRVLSEPPLQEPPPDLEGQSPAAETPLPSTLGDVGQILETTGAFALDDLVFASGASTLVSGDYESLSSLAKYLAANPDKSIALVGHTDASGSLETNVALSRKRAAAVRTELISTYGANPRQIRAEGVGYLAPRASNLTPEGRTANRRVEAMLTSTQ